MTQTKPHTEAPSIRDLYPGLSDAELAEAEENLDRYLSVVLQIHERIRNDAEAYAEFKTLSKNPECLHNDDLGNPQSSCSAIQLEDS